MMSDHNYCKCGAPKLSNYYYCGDCADAEIERLGDCAAAEIERSQRRIAELDKRIALLEEINKTMRGALEMQVDMNEYRYFGGRFGPNYEECIKISKKYPEWKQETQEMSFLEWLIVETTCKIDQALRLARGESEGESWT